jgi:Holliday junction resolvasome RuvABC endonuclease subunit
MRCGVDPASGTTGIAFVDDNDNVVETAVFTANKKLPIASQMMLFHKMFTVLCKKHKPRIVVVEKVSVSWNLDTVRKIAYYEAIAMLVAEKHKATVLQINVGSARKKALGKNMPKEAAAEVVREKYGQLLSLDETDAIVCALAG